MEAAAEGILAAADERDRAIADLFRFHYADLVRLASLITADHAMAEELTQEAFVRTWRAWNRIRNEDSAPLLPAQNGNKSLQIISARSNA